MIENFIFNDIVLYCKGWYETPEGNTMLDDLGYLFEEIYGWKPKTEEEIAHKMLVVLDRLYEEMEEKFVFESHRLNFSRFHDEVRRNMRLYDCSFSMGTIRVVHSILQCLSKDEIKLNPPVYGKGKHFRMGGFFQKRPISMTYKEMNRIAEKAFKYEK